MTLLNAFARARDGAWLMADTAQFWGDGRIARFERKIETSDRLRFAIGHTGRLEAQAARYTREWLAMQVNEQRALAALPGLLADLVAHDEEAVRAGGDQGLEAGIQLVVAYWDDADNRGKCALIGSTPELSPDVPVFTVRPVVTMLRPDPGAQIPRVEETIWPTPYLEGVASIQRREPHDDGTYRVGGEVELVRVHADGVDRHTICEWPEDRVGRLILPNGRSLNASCRWPPARLLKRFGISKRRRAQCL